MANFNKVILAGNLTRDPEMRYLPSNVAVCEFGLAVNRRWRDRDGNQKEEVCFVDVSAWGRQAETINQYMKKGRSILIEGRLKFDSWTGQDGARRSKLSVVAENFTFLGSREAGDVLGAAAAHDAPHHADQPAASRAPRSPGPPRTAAGDAPPDDLPTGPQPDDIPF
jgi:single-strand DNA-binding protein